MVEGGGRFGGRGDVGAAPLMPFDGSTTGSAISLVSAICGDDAISWQWYKVCTSLEQQANRTATKGCERRTPTLPPEQEVKYELVITILFCNDLHIPVIDSRVRF